MHENPYQPPAQAYHHPHPGYGPVIGAPVQPPPRVSVLSALGFAFSGNVGFGKLLLGLLLMIIPLVGPICLAGWLAETHRRLVYRQAPTTRSFVFDEFMSYLMAGLVPFVAQLVATFVAMVPFGLFAGIFGGVLISTGSGGEPAQAVLLVAVLVFALVTLVTMVFVMAIVTVLTIRAELTGSFEQTFAMGPAWAMFKRQWLPIFGHHLLLGLLAIPLMLLGVMAFFIGIYVVVVALQFAQLHLRWQIYEADLRMGGQSLSVIPGNGATMG